MEMLAVIGRVARGLGGVDAALARRAVTAGIDRAQIGEEIDRAQELGERVAAPIPGAA